MKYEADPLRELLGELWKANDRKKGGRYRQKARKEAARQAAKLTSLLLNDEEPIPPCEGVVPKEEGNHHIDLLFRVGEN